MFSTVLIVRGWNIYNLPFSLQRWTDFRKEESYVRNEFLTTQKLETIDLENPIVSKYYFCIRTFYNYRIKALYDMILCEK